MRRDETSELTEVIRDLAILSADSIAKLTIIGGLLALQIVRRGEAIYNFRCFRFSRRILMERKCSRVSNAVE